MDLHSYSKLKIIILYLKTLEPFGFVAYSILLIDYRAFLLHPSFSETRDKKNGRKSREKCIYVEILSLRRGRIRDGLGSDLFLSLSNFMNHTKLHTFKGWEIFTS